MSNTGDEGKPTMIQGLQTGQISHRKKWAQGTSARSRQYSLSLVIYVIPTTNKTTAAYF
jgi:hypothetical protein